MMVVILVFNVWNHSGSLPSTNAANISSWLKWNVAMHQYKQEGRKGLQANVNNAGFCWWEVLVFYFPFISLHKMQHWRERKPACWTWRLFTNVRQNISHFPLKYWLCGSFTWTQNNVVKEFPFSWVKGKLDSAAQVRSTAWLCNAC